MMNIKALTFDYFGTLVNVDEGATTGITEVCRLLSVDSGRSASDLYRDWDIRTIRLYRGSSYQRFRIVAREGLRQCLEATAPGCLAGQDIEKIAEVFLGHLVESSPPHGDAVQFLDWAKERFPLMPITNMDTDLWKRSRLAHYFENVTTAEMAKAYKPSHQIFLYALDRLDLAPENVLHCSISHWADIDGAKPLGMNVAWINRWEAKLGTFQARPDFEFSTLTPVIEILNKL